MSSGFLHRIEVRYLKETLIDIETYSEVDIGKCGLYRYATDPSFEILLVAWATDEGDGFGETRCADLASGEPLPKELLEDFQSGNVRLIAHNASFERVCLSVHLNRHYPGQYLKPGEFLSPDSWICTMIMAASLTLPMALKDVGTVLKTSQQKDKEGERLIKLFSMPCKPTKSNGMRTRNLPEHYPADWEKFMTSATTGCLLVPHHSHRLHRREDQFWSDPGDHHPERQAQLLHPLCAEHSQGQQQAAG